MKISFFILLAANIVFFLWEVRSGRIGPQEAELAAAAGAEKQIILFDELVQKAADRPDPVRAVFKKDVIAARKSSEKPAGGQGEVPAAPETANPAKIETMAETFDVVQETTLYNETADTSPVTPQCKKAGLFPDRKSAYSWLSTNNQKLNAPEILEVEQEIQSYMVYYPAAAGGMKQSEANVAMLRRQGANDTWLFRDGDMKGIISLGIFNDLKRAETLKKLFVDKGLSVEIMPRKKKMKKFMVSIPMDVNDETAIAQLPETDGVTILESDCGKTELE